MSRAHDRMRLRHALDDIEVLGTDAPTTSAPAAAPFDQASFWSNYGSSVPSAPAAAPEQYGPPAPAASAPAAAPFNADDYWTRYAAAGNQPAAPAPATSAPAASQNATGPAADYWRRYAAAGNQLPANQPRGAAPYRSPYGAQGKPKGAAGFFDTNVPGINRPLWQVGLGAVGIIGIGVGGYMLLMKTVPARSTARGYAR